MKMTRFTRIALVNLVLTIVLLALVEIVAWRYNRQTESGGRPLFFDTTHRESGVRQEGGTAKMSFIDPHLGYAHDTQTDLNLGADPAIPGFVIYGDVGQADALRIVALGGSTTDPLDRENWPKVLLQDLESAGIPAIVYNGGVSGYSSNQELLKLIRDVLPLEPDIVVSLNGINDLGFLHSIPSHPMVHPYQRRLLESIAHKKPPRILPNVVTIGRRFIEGRVPKLNRIKGIHYGTYVVTQDHQQWARNVRLMHTIASEFEIAFVSFLQPTLGIGEYDSSPEDLRLIAEATRERGLYLDRLESFYGEARDVAAKSEYIEDFTDLFAGKTGLYRDARHPNAEGYALIARSIFDTLRDRGIFDTAALERVRKSYEESVVRFQQKYEKGTTEPSSNPDATALPGGEQRDDFLGLSGPRIVDGTIIHRSPGDFFISGWYIADSRYEVFAEIDGERYTARYVTRRDVEEKYPEYQYRPGWIVRVPAERLTQDVTLAFYLGDKKYYDVNVAIPK